MDIKGEKTAARWLKYCWEELHKKNEFQYYLAWLTKGMEG
jgi:hypothetical protein